MTDRRGFGAPAGDTAILEARSGMAQFLRFCVAGTIGFLVDVAVLYCAVGLLGWYAARVLSFMVAVTVTWWFNRRFTFVLANARNDHAGARFVLREYFRYVGSMMGGALVNYAAYVLVLKLVPMPYAGAIGVAAGSIAGLGVNFGAARLLVFRR